MCLLDLPYLEMEIDKGRHWNQDRKVEKMMAWLKITLPAT